MNYKLAKELKTAGFPQKIGIAYGVHLDPMTGSDGCKPTLTDERSESIDYDTYVFVPTLSELIDALEEYADKWEMTKDNGMYKVFYDDISSHPQMTLEEAVAELWIKLNRLMTNFIQTH